MKGEGPCHARVTLAHQRSRIPRALSLLPFVRRLPAFRQAAACSQWRDDLDERRANRSRCQDHVSPLCFPNSRTSAQAMLADAAKRQSSAERDTWYATVGLKSTCLSSVGPAWGPLVGRRAVWDSGVI